MNSPFHRWERRRVPRFEVEELVSLTIFNDEERKTTGTCKDLSTGGMFCMVNVMVKPGTKLEFLLNLPSEAMLVQPVRLGGTGKVVRVQREENRYGLGVSFDSIQVATH